MSKIICIGDSIVEGAGDKNGIGWVGRLARKLSFENTVYNLGIGGNTIYDVSNRIFTEALIRKPDILIVSTGANETQKSPKTGEYIISPERAQLLWERFLEQINKAISQSYVLSGLPINESKIESTHNTARIIEINTMLAELCRKYGNVEYIDLFEDWKKLTLEEYLYDGLHPNAKGYDLLAKQIYKAIFINKHR